MTAIPMFGLVLGSTTGIAPGAEVEIPWRRLSFYAESEYVFDLEQSDESFFYTWLDASLAPTDWLRFGLVAQRRTRAYETGLDVQRGLLLEVSRGNLSFGFHWFKPDRSEQDLRLRCRIRVLMSGMSTASSRAAVGIAFVVAGLCCTSAVSAQENQDRAFRVGGLLCGDLYHVASHHTEEGDGATGAVLRRGYLTFGADFSKRWYGRLRFELNQAGEFETYRFEVSFKDLFVGWKAGRHRLLFGLSPPPTFDLIETIWGFRYLVRTPLDLQGVARRDTGIAAQGPLNAAGNPFDPTARATFFVGGLEFRVKPNLSITPNTVVIAYDRNDQGVKPSTDFHLRLTILLDLD